MPWCPRCDETFPQGPACPRCSARLVAREQETYEDPLHSVPGLKSVKVSRRYLRALERLSGPRPSGSRAMALALVTLVFASGFLLGRAGSIGSNPGGPTVRALAAAKPIAHPDVKGSVAYLTTSRDPLATVAMHDLDSGDVTPRVRLSPPVDDPDHITTRSVAFGRSVAVVVSAAGQSHVAFRAWDHAPQGWVPGIEAAWTTEQDLLIRHADGSIARWTFGPRSVTSVRADDADELIQTSAGAVVRRGSVLESVDDPSRRLGLPSRGRLVAVAPDMASALLDDSGPTLWDGRTRVPMRTGNGETLGATFDRASERVAVVLRGQDGLSVAIVDEKGRAQHRVLSGGDGCEGPPAWDAAGLWVYVAGGDGVLHAVDAKGVRQESIQTQAAGCGLSWMDIPSYGQ